jgi:hypothetical protein
MRRAKDTVLTRYLAMNSSIEDTLSPTSFSIVLYCAIRRVHAGEYLLSNTAEWKKRILGIDMKRTRLQ